MTQTTKTEYTGPTLTTKEDGLYIQTRDDEHKVLRGWESMNGWYWFATEVDEQTGRCFGLVQGFEHELGYFSINELEANKPMVWELPQKALPYSGVRS